MKNKEEEKIKYLHIPAPVSRTITGASFRILSSYLPQGQARRSSAGPFIEVNWTQERTVTDILVVFGFLARHT